MIYWRGPGFNYLSWCNYITIPRTHNSLNIKSNLIYQLRILDCIQQGSSQKSCNYPEIHMQLISYKQQLHRIVKLISKQWNCQRYFLVIKWWRPRYGIWEGLMTLGKNPKPEVALQIGFCPYTSQCYKVVNNYFCSKLVVCWWNVCSNCQIPRS
jgi:hypothetical protein